MKIRWSLQSTQDLHAISRYIGADSEQAAKRVIRKVITAVGDLPSFPARGRPGHVPNTRELVLVPLPYIVVYRVAAGSIEVIRVLHGAQGWQM